MDIDIRNYPDRIDEINAVLNNKGIAEVKIERSGPVVVEIKRTLKTPKEK